jgi:hypothetical protein
LCFDKMVTVNRSWNGSCVHSSGHELQQSHLCSCILACDTLADKIVVSFIQAKRYGLRRTSGLSFR